MFLVARVLFMVCKNIPLQSFRPERTLPNNPPQRGEYKITKQLQEQNFFQGLDIIFVFVYYLNIMISIFKFSTFGDQITFKK
jgi:hypothetical protein